ncbi:unnamed protein product [Choristocarpus tenellus]
MFLAAMTHPRKVSNWMWFDGKIGIWPIMDTKVAQCSSKHRPKSTKVFVPVTVGRERYKKLMIKDFIPAIKAHMPQVGSTQHLHAAGRGKVTHQGGIMEAIKDVVGDDIVIETQSAHSPDLNVNDLEFFHSIEELKEDVGVTNTE